MANEVATSLLLLSEIIKESWVGTEIVDQLMKKSQFWNYMFHRSKSMKHHDWIGQKLQFPISIGDGTGFGHLGASNALPLVNATSIEQTFSLQMSRYLSHFKYGVDYLQSKDKRQVGRKMKADMRKNITKAHDQISRELVQDGGNFLTAITDTPTSLGSDLYTVPVNNTDCAPKESYVEIVDSSGTKIAGATCIVKGKSVQTGAGTVTLYCAVDLSSLVSATNRIAIENTSQSGNVAIHNLADIVNNSGYYPSAACNGLDRSLSANTDWQSVVMDMTVAPYLGKSPLRVFRHMFKQLFQNQQVLEESDPNGNVRAKRALCCVYGDSDIIDQIVEDAQDGKIVNDDKPHDLAFPCPTLNGIPLIGDALISQRIYFLNFDNWHTITKPLTWGPGIGAFGGFFNHVSDTDTYQAFNTFMAQMHCDRLAGQGVAKNFTASEWTITA